IRPETKSRLGATRPLSEMATVEVGIQTSLDSFFLFDFVRQCEDPSLVVVKNKLDKTEVVLEWARLFRCAKGSRDLDGDRIKSRRYVLWPYDADGSLMEGDALEANFPYTWHCLLEHSDRLKSREKGKFDDSEWWRFRRPQGVK